MAQRRLSMSEPKKCLREGCEDDRRSNGNPYCKKHRSAYQKAIRLKKEGSYINDPYEPIVRVDGVQVRRSGRPFRPVDDDVIYFLNKINGKATE